MNNSKTVWYFIRKKPWAALAVTLFVIVQAILNVAEVVILEHFIDNFLVFQGKLVVFFAVILSGMYAFRYFQTPFMNYFQNSIRMQLRGYMDHVVISKMARISVAALENTDNQALFNRLQQTPENRYVNGFFSVLQILGGMLSMVGIFLLIIDTVPFFLLVILLLLGLMVIVFRWIGKNRVALYQARQEINRRGDYLAGLLFERHLAQEKKLFGYTPYIQKLYEEENIHSGNRLIRSIFASNLILWFYDNITYLFSASAYLFLLIPLYQGEIDIGLYVAIIPALARLGSFFVAVGSNYLPSYQEYKACLVDFHKLEELPEQYYIQERKENSQEEVPSFHRIKGENLVFRYSENEKPVINGLHFTFYSGKKYALVGENGCGKTTFIKLLMGFYQPESGTITIDGKDIKEMKYGELQKYFSAVFQDFNRYDYTIKENIFLSHLGGNNKIQQAAKEAELENWISSFTDTYDTKLGNLEEGGVDCSGGQWQRLAIARMLYKPASIYIWDEPTAAMDPLAESRFYTAFLQKRSEACTNLFVTHRLGAAVSADEICVMANGRFVEQGNHIQLMQKQDGLYYQMFQAQKGMYE